MATKVDTNTAVTINDKVFAYLGDNDILTDLHGDKIGTYKIVKTWRTPKSFVSTTMNQVVAKVDGVFYTGRSAGISMSYYGKRKAVQGW